MPRLSDDSSGGQPASAYPRPRIFQPLRFVAYCFFFLTLRNILTNDYRGEEIGYLRTSGLKDEQIEQFVPKTQEERLIMQRKKAVDQVQMLREIELLKEQVHELRMMVFNGTDITKTKTVTDGETKLSTKKEQKQPIKLDEEKLLQSSEKERS
eukprot:g12000.t1 g12000   contig6:1019753-1020390(-)